MGLLNRLLPTTGIPPNSVELVEAEAREHCGVCSNVRQFEWLSPDDSRRSAFNSKPFGFTPGKDEQSIK